VLLGTQTTPYVESSTHSPCGDSVSRKSVSAEGSVSAAASYSDGLDGSAADAVALPDVCAVASTEALAPISAEP